jgi:hypothetical protein
MWNWIASVWNRINRWMHREKVPQSYHRSNLHGRHR